MEWRGGSEQGAGDRCQPDRRVEPGAGQDLVAGIRDVRGRRGLRRHRRCGDAPPSPWPAQGVVERLGASLRNGVAVLDGWRLRGPRRCKVSNTSATFPLRTSCDGDGWYLRKLSRIPLAFPRPRRPSARFQRRRGEGGEDAPVFLFEGRQGAGEGFGSDVGRQLLEMPAER